MKVMSSEWRGRLNHWIRTLEDDIYEPLEVISLEFFETSEYLSPMEARQREFRPVEPGFTWGKTWEYGWFCGKIRIPERAAGKKVVLRLAPGGESTLFINGRAFGTYRADWLSNPMHYYEDNILTSCARGGEEYDLLFETYAGHYYPECPEGGCATGPVLPGSYQDPLKEGSRRTLGECTFGIFHEEAYQLLMDVRTLSSLMDVLDPTSLRAAKIARALERFTLAVDFEQPGEDRTKSYLEGRKVLRESLAAKNGSTAPVFYAIGHAHLDLAWLWPMAETYRKTARTFAAQLRLLDEYPDYKYIQSQPAAYEMCRKYYPELFERIKEAVKEGRWIPEGAMWVEPDTNMPSGESLIRQCLYGKAYFRKEFGTDSRILWLPDSFGYTGSLPQILKGCGVDYLVTQKIFWTYNDAEEFPYHYFTWEGTDGSRVTAFLPTDYNYKTDPAAVCETWRKRRQVQDLDAFLMPFGYGDGGGGPARDYIEFCEREKDLEGMPKVRMASPLEFFEDMKNEGGPVNTYVGELYFQAHRGTYTTQAKTKKNNRRAEFALHNLELWKAAASLSGNGSEKEMLPDTESLWKELLLHQFHDILPGSGIERVYKEADARVKAVIQKAEAGAAICQKSMLCEENPTGAVTVWNSLGFERNALVRLPKRFSNGAEGPDGTYYPAALQDGNVYVSAKLPPFGAETLFPSERRVMAGRKVRAQIQGDGTILLENEKVRVVVLTGEKDAGEIQSYVLKETGTEFAAAPMNRFLFFKDVPRLFDAWDIDSNYRLQELPGLTDASIRIKAGEEEDSLTACLLMTGKIGNSEIRQRIRLEAGSPVLKFETEVNWSELHRLLKVSFPVTVYETEGYNEMQYGYVKRPAHKSRLYDRDRYEVCNHRYSALADGSHGAAVLNDCKYGISMTENALELTLLRAAAAPEMRADNGPQSFTYGFTAWTGPFASCDVVRRGYELNVPPEITEGKIASEKGCFSLIQTDRENVIADTLKTAEDGSGDIIIRLYESKRCPCRVMVKTPWEGPVFKTDMLENIQQEIPSEKGTFSLTMHSFEVCTVRIRVS